MAATIRSLNAVRTSLANARDICTEPEIISALTDAIDELDAALLDLVQQEGKILDATDALLAHVEPPKETKPVPLTAGMIADEAWQFAVAMTRVHMGVAS